MLFWRGFLTAGLLLTSIDSLAADEAWHSESKQILRVDSSDWDATTGVLQRWEKGAKGWERIGDPIRVILGKNGLGIGLGLHRELEGGPTKQEGDGKGPAGIFLLEGAFGVDPVELERFDYRVTTASDRWVDDPNSRHYNRWVVLDGSETRKDWTSAEKLRLASGLYDLAIIVGHNRDPIVKGRGSAIFMHLANPNTNGTAGCTTAKRDEIEAILFWLDREKVPVLIQGPTTWLTRLDLPSKVTEAKAK